MEQYRYTRKIRNHDKTVLALYHIYNIEQIGKYLYQVYALPYNCPICTITSKCLNYCFEHVD